MNENFFSFSQKIVKLADSAEKDCQPIFQKLLEIGEKNQLRVLKAFHDNKVSESHFIETTGYGYGDRGRETLDRVFADIFEAQDALVRHNFVSGTHALTVALFGILRPKDIVCCVTGTPYDTIQPVFGLTGSSGMGSLADFGVHYKQLDLLENGTVDLHNIANACSDAKMVYIQRSRGYSLRPSLSIDDIEKVIEIVRSINKNAIVMVDNCYGEFVEIKEPTSVGADIIVGSLIKNPGGGMAKTGGYIAGRTDLIELCANRLTAVGIGKEVGCTLGQNNSLFKGIFLAPNIVLESLKSAIFASRLFELLGFNALPKFCEKRTDIIQSIELNTPENLIAFCTGIQKGAPIDSFVVPEPWDMPGYASKVIMAAGAFNMGASIELSADAPLVPPYAVWLQGGLTYFSAKYGIMKAADLVAPQT